MLNQPTVLYSLREAKPSTIHKLNKRTKNALPAIIKYPNEAGYHTIPNEKITNPNIQVST